MVTSVRPHLPRRLGRTVAATVVAGGLLAGSSAVASAVPRDPDAFVTVDEDGYTPGLAWLGNLLGGKPLRIHAGAFEAADGLGSVDLDILKQNAAWRLAAPHQPRVGQTVIVTWEDGSTSTFKILCLTGTACAKVIKDEPAPPPPATRRQPGPREGGFREREAIDMARSNERWLNEAIQRSTSRIPIVTVGPIYRIR